MWVAMLTIVIKLASVSAPMCAKLHPQKANHYPIMWVAMPTIKLASVSATCAKLHPQEVDKASLMFPFLITW